MPEPSVSVNKERTSNSYKVSTEAESMYTAGQQDPDGREGNCLFEGMTPWCPGAFITVFKVGILYYLVNAFFLMIKAAV